MMLTTLFGNKAIKNNPCYALEPIVLRAYPAVMHTIIFPVQDRIPTLPRGCNLKSVL